VVRVLAIAARVAQTAPDLAAINKRMVHRQAEVLGLRSAIRTGTEFQALAGHQASVAEFKKDPLAAMKRIMAPPPAPS
jgi:enoyl-CoA hydratase